MTGDEDDSPLAGFVEPDSLPVFVEEHGDQQFRIAPRFNHGRLRWAVRVNEGSRVLYEDVRGLDEEAAERFDVGEDTRERINADRKFVHRRFPNLPVKGNRRLVEHPLAEVEAIMEEW